MGAGGERHPKKRVELNKSGNTAPQQQHNNVYIFIYIYIERERERKRERRAFMQMRKGGSMESYQASVRREVRGWGQAGRSGRGFPSSGGNGAQFKHQKTKTKEKLSNTSGFRIFFSLSPHYTDQTHHQINYELISPPLFLY